MTKFGSISLLFIIRNFPKIDLRKTFISVKLKLTNTKIFFMEIGVITKNPGKLMVARKSFEEFGIKVVSIEREYPEIQADTSLEIARYTAVQAANELKIPLIREDHSLYINSLGIPGPYTAYVEKRISAGKLLQLLEKDTGRRGFFEVATVYADPSGLIKEYVFKVPIRISPWERGSLQKGWARLIILGEEKRTIAEYPEKERITVWNKNYLAIAAWMASQQSVFNKNASKD